MTPELYHPVLDYFLRAPPHTYRSMSAENGTLLRFDIAGECGGTWRLLREAIRWRLLASPTIAPGCRVSIPQEIAWRIFIKGIEPAAAEAQARVEEDRRLAEPALSMVAIVA
jgi:hypothetical protein